MISQDPKLTWWLWKIMNDEERKKRLIQHQTIKREYFSKQREDSMYLKKITQVCPKPSKSVRSTTKKNFFFYLAPPLLFSKYVRCYYYFNFELIIFVFVVVLGETRGFAKTKISSRNVQRSIE